MQSLEQRASWAGELTDRVLTLRDGLARSVSIGISGVDCSGKSTLAEALRLRLEAGGARTLVLAGDAFTRPTTDRYREADAGLGYYRDSFDYSELFDLVLPAVRRGVAERLLLRVSDWERDTWREQPLVLEPNTVVIVEGCFLFKDGDERAFDLSVWIDLPLDRVVERALRRAQDLERMGGPEGVRERYGRRYLPGQALHLERDDPGRRATLVLSPDPESHLE